MSKHYRWNKQKCANNLLALATVIGAAGLIVWLTCTWILSA